ncbi:MAG: T9SS type A sorting domain-containing protein [Sphingobacteriales bacterium]|nr:MAG: T9SS type A sorting domain-containing protein [Sphingobacteriales bacterium]
MKKITLIISLLLISFALKAQDYNLDFENWAGVLQPVMNSTDSCTLPANAASNPFDTRLNAWTGNNGVLRTTDAHSGSYAAIVAIWYANTTGKLILGQCGAINVPGYSPCKQHFSSRIYGVSGYYKYLVDSFMPRDVQDTRAVGYIKTFKVNPSDQSVTVLSFDSLVFNRANTYQSFQLPVTYADSNHLPDSVSIWFESQNNAPGGLTCAYAHFLYLDELTFNFSPMPAGLGKPAFKKKVNLYPSPANGTVNLEYGNELQVERIWLSDLSGRKIKTFDPRAKSLPVKVYPAGVYLLHIQSRQGLISEKIVLE